MVTEAPAVIHLVPHTHWDREWYEPFQVFRMRLVELVDELLDSMEADDRLAFTLDGQVATVDDYLEVRPEGRPRIERLIAEGRLAIGPWQILMDEFLVSGETIIRNLEIGWSAAEGYGAAMPIGYLPDMFGHIAQMPQLLRRAGIDQAVVWRGVPAAIDRSAFAWRSPDGSTVRAEYLVGGYGNGAYLLAIPDLLADKVGRYVEASRPFYGERSVLAMYGTDHAVPSPDLATTVAAANRQRDDVVVRIETLRDYLAGFGAEARAAAAGEPTELPAWTGELRSAARANILMNVTSARMDGKAAASRAERILERQAEPLAAIHGGPWPARLLELAWRRVVDNSAHDSSCGCSRDEVVNQVLSRYAEAEQIGRGVLAAAIRPLAAAAPRGSAVIVNPSPFDRTEVVEVDLDVPAAWQGVDLELPDGSRVPTQLLDRPEPVLHRLRMPGREVPELFARRLHGRELFGRSLDGHELRLAGGSRELVLRMDDPDALADFDVDALLDACAAATLADPDAGWDVVVVRADRRRLLAAIPLPPLGATVVRPAEAGSASGLATPLAITDRGLDNGLVRVDVADDGSYAVEGRGSRLAGVGRIVDGGDYGDTYNYGPPADDRLVERPDGVVVRVMEIGPVRGRIEIVADYAWPIGLGGGERSRRSDETAPVTVVTRLELRVGEPFVRVELAFTNPSRDHRVRVHVPLPASADHSSAGLISRNDNPFREDPAGPEVPVPGAQMLGPWRFGFALLPHAGSWDAVDAHRAADRFRLPPTVAPGRAAADAPAAATAGLRVDGDGVVL